MKLLSSGGPGVREIPEDSAPAQGLQLERLLKIKQEKKQRKLEAENEEKEEDKEEMDDEKALIRKMLARLERPSKKDA